MSRATSVSKSQAPRATERQLRQRYSSQQRLRAYLYGRLPLLLESLVSLGLVALVLLIDVLVLLAAPHPGGTPYTPVDGLIDALKLLTFQSGGDQQAGVGPLLYAANVLFALFFIQTNHTS